MKMRDTSGDATYKMNAWIEQFNKAGPGERLEVAEKWLAAFLDDLRLCKGMSEALDMRDRLTKHMMGVRSMLWTLPAHHPLFDRAPFSANNPGGTWINHYLNMAVPLMSSTNASKLHADLRDMWLHPQVEVRRNALAEMAKDTGRLKVLGPLWDPLIRDAAWETAAEAGRSATAVKDATLLTLWTFRGLGSRVNVHTRHELNNAINILLSLCEDGGSPTSSQQVEESKALLVPYPAACVIFLQWIQEESPKEWTVLGPTKNPKEALMTWFPGSQSVIRLCGEMGMSHQEILKQIEASLPTTTEQALPDDLSIESEP